MDFLKSNIYSQIDRRLTYLATERKTVHSFQIQTPVSRLNSYVVVCHLLYVKSYNTVNPIIPMLLYFS